MGSTLGVLLADSFMGCVEEEAFKNFHHETENEEDTEQLRLRLQETSGLTFTIEKSTNGTMPFLDVLVEQETDSFTTGVYAKPTGTGN